MSLKLLGRPTYFIRDELVVFREGMDSGIQMKVFCLTFRNDSVDRKKVLHTPFWLEEELLVSTYVVLFFEWGVCMVGTGNHQLHHDMPCNFPRKVGFSVCMDGSDSCLCLAFEDGETKWTSRWDNYWKTIWGYTGNVKKRMVDDAYQKRANEFCTFGDLKRLCFDVIIDKSISKVYKLAFWCSRRLLVVVVVSSFVCACSSFPMYTPEF